MHLDERFDLTPLLQPLCAHAPGYFARVTLDPSNNGMRVRSLLGAFVILLDNDDLLAGLAALQHDGDLTSSSALFLSQH